MKYSYNWLKELSGTKKLPKQLAELLMMRAFEVEEVSQSSNNLENVFVGRIVKLEKHPNADKLRVAEVTVGKKDIRRIVCGAPNVELGQKVVVALPGAKLLGGMEIKVVVLRGVKSRGMICSARELGLGDNHNGIFILPADALIGVPFAKYCGLEDSVMEIKILPDRGSDALAYQGMSREIAAIGGHKPRFTEKASAPPLKIPRNNRATQIVISDPKACRRYLGISFENVAVAESPLWLKVKLILSGLRPINNIVDITNYLMLLTGQPSHAFDADKIIGTITIRRAEKNEKLTLLTGETKKLSLEDLVIADDKQVLALAGVMGCGYAAVTERTKNIFLEIANFDSATVRRSKTRHNLPTDASYRFERALDPNIPGEVAGEASVLITSFASGTYVGMRDVYPRKIKEWKITLSFARIKNVLGAEIPSSEVVRYLNLLGLVVKKTRKAFAVTVPTRRPDLRDEWNLIEEIGRMYGYGNIVPAAPLLPLVLLAQNDEKRFERECKEYLVHAGFDEIMTYSFYGEKEIVGAMLPLDHHLELENPLSPEQKYLRMTLAPIMLRKARENLRNFDHFDCFEWGRVFGGNPKTHAIGEVKTLLLIAAFSGKNGRDKAASKTGKAFYAMKGKTEAFFEALHIDTSHITFEPVEKFPKIPVLAMLHPTRSACIVSRGKFIGLIGELHPKALKAFNLESSHIAIAEFFSDELRALWKREIIFTPLPKFPFATRDISLTFPRSLAGKHFNRRNVTVAEVEKLLIEAGAPLLKKWELFDVYEKDDEKRLAFHLSFGADNRTLPSEEMDKAFDRIVVLAKERFKAHLRY